MAVQIRCPNPACKKVCDVAAADELLKRLVSCPHCGTRFTASTSSQDAPRPQADRRTQIGAAGETTDGIQSAPAKLRDGGKLPGRIGRFQIRAFLGAGMFGTVYRAYDPQLHREVALKVPQANVLDSPRRVERFLREARAAAQLRHPHIVPVHDAGHDGEQYYIASAFIAGQTLAEVCDDGPFEPRRATQIVRDLAEALAYAHEQGIVHRDVKPANVMIDAKGQPHLMDFGLAARQDSEEKLTVDGAILGTAAYIAPEHAAGRQGDPKAASDQYSLGVVLYELLCGRTPFAGPPPVVLFHAVHTEPPAPRSIRPNLPRDLETICLKAQAKKPEARFENCQELADDLRRWLEGEPIRSRRVSVPERVVRWCKREPKVAVTALVAVLCLAALALVASLSAGKFAVLAKQEADARAQEADARVKATSAELDARSAERDAVDQREKATTALAEAKQLNAKFALLLEEKDKQDKALTRSECTVYVGNIARAQAAWNDGRITDAWDVLDSCRLDFRGWEHDYLYTLFSKNQKTFRGHSFPVHSVAWSPDGKRIVSAGGDNTVKVWDATTGKETLTMYADPGGVCSLAWSGDGKQIVSGSETGTLKVWDAATGVETHTLSAKGAGQVSSVAWSGDGKRIVSAGHALNTPKVWDAATGQETLSLKGHTDGVNSVAWSGDGKRIVSGSYDHTVKVWDATTGKATLTINAHTGGVSSVAWSGDGKRIVSAGKGDNTLKVWDAATGQETFTLKGHTDEVISVAWSGDGERIVSGSYDRTVKVWDATTGQDTLTIKAHTVGVTSVAWSGDGKRIVSASYFDDTMVTKVWDAATGQETFTLKGHTDRVTSVAWSPDGKRIASASGDGTLKAWDASTGQEALTIKAHTGGITSVAWSGDGKRIVSASDNTPKVWDTATGEETHTLKGHTDQVLSVAWSRDGKWIVSGSKDNTLKVWDAATGQETLALKGHTDRVTSVAWSPDGKRIVSASDDGTLKLWDASTGQEALTIKAHTGQVDSVAWSPDGKRIVSGSHDGTLKIWDATTSQKTLTLNGQSGPASQSPPAVLPRR